MQRRVLLVILDGWGIAPAGPANAISLARTSNFDLFWSKYPHTLLAASGEGVGLPAGQMGNSEVGHLNLGAGRVVLQDLPRISSAIRTGEFFKNETLLKTFKYAKEKNKPLHLIGLVSPGGVHSHQEHLYALLEFAKKEKVPQVYIHVITDGRDTEPKSAEGYVAALLEKIKEIGIGEIATIMGRYYGMDRDNRWSREELAYVAIVEGKGETESDPLKAIEKSYKRGVTDEFIRPVIVNKEGLINDEDAVIFFNLRSDRPRELTKALILDKFDSFKRRKVLHDLYFVTMTEYEDDLPVQGVIFPPEIVENSLAQVLSEDEKKQYHIAETEKYAHVTFFFNGGREAPFTLEDRTLIPSPQVTTYDKKPEMSAEKIATELTEKIGRYDFMMVNFANPDMVGHTGNIEATVRAIETVDSCLGGVAEAAKAMNYEVIVVADHGNAEKMINPDGSPCTTHTTNPVPFIFISKDIRRIKPIVDPKLANIAPTILDLMGIERPREMKESSLLLPAKGGIYV